MVVSFPFTTYVLTTWLLYLGVTKCIPALTLTVPNPPIWMILHTPSGIRVKVNTEFKNNKTNIITNVRSQPQMKMWNDNVLAQLVFLYFTKSIQISSPKNSAEIIVKIYHIPYCWAHGCFCINLLFVFVWWDWGVGGGGWVFVLIIIFVIFFFHAPNIQSLLKVCTCTVHT